MAQLGQKFDARNVDPTQTAPSLPVGRHPVIIESSEIKENSKKDGGYLQFDLKVIDGPLTGAKGAYRLNLYHSNPQTVEIAYKQLSAICHVCQVWQLEDSQQLHNIPFIVEVGMQKTDEAKAKGYTQVERVYDRNGNEPGKQGQTTPPPATTAAPPAGAGGWGGPPQTQQQPPQGQASGGTSWGAGQQQTPPPASNPPASNPGPWSSQQSGNGGGATSAGTSNTPPWGQR